jgi:hypothetical protein
MSYNLKLEVIKTLFPAKPSAASGVLNVMGNELNFRELQKIVGMFGHAKSPTRFMTFR